VLNVAVVFSGSGREYRGACGPKPRCLPGCCTLTPLAETSPTSRSVPDAQPSIARCERHVGGRRHRRVGPSPRVSRILRAEGQAGLPSWGTVPRGTSTPVFALQPAPDPSTHRPDISADADVACVNARPMCVPDTHAHHSCASLMRMDQRYLCASPPRPAHVETSAIIRIERSCGTVSRLPGLSGVRWHKAPRSTRYRASCRRATLPRETPRHTSVLLRAMSAMGAHPYDEATRSS
jgi:hypothetical protein